jgi:hypothetical protein
MPLSQVKLSVAEVGKRIHLPALPIPSEMRQYGRVAGLLGGKGGFSPIPEPRRTSLRHALAGASAGRGGAHPRPGCPGARPGWRHRGIDRSGPSWPASEMRFSCSLTRGVLPMNLAPGSRGLPLSSPWLPALSEFVYLPSGVTLPTESRACWRDEHRAQDDIRCRTP